MKGGYYKYLWVYIIDPEKMWVCGIYAMEPLGTSPHL